MHIQLSHCVTRRLCSLGTVAATLLLLSLGSGCATDKAVIDQANQFDSGLKPAEIRNSDVDAYFQQVGSRIVKAAQQLDAEHKGPDTHFKGGDSKWMFQNVQFHLVNSKTLNA